MRNRTLFAACLLSACCLFLLACPRHYLSQGTLAPSFNKQRTYRVAILPITVEGAGTEVGSAVREAGMNKLGTILMSTGKFMIVDRAKVAQVVRVNEFGSSGAVDAVLARRLGKEVGADLVVLTELEQTVTGGLPLLARVRLLDVDQDTYLYTGQGRADNPVAPEAGAELAVELATRVLVRSLK